MTRYHKRLVRISVLAVVFVLPALWYGLPFLVPLPEVLEHPLDHGTRYIASDGTPLRHLLNADGLRTSPPVAFEQLPEPLIKATLAAEDRRFFSHGGIDLISIARSAWMNARARRVLSGASTITQQLVKSWSVKQRRTLAAKVIEALRARHLEMRWTKPQILAAYLNRVSYGNLCTGCDAAAEGYFHKPLRDLTAAECAFLAALPQAPGRLNPFRDTSAILKREQRILTRMHELGWLADEAFTIASAQPITLQRYRGGFIAPHAIDLLNQAAATQPVVRTTLEPRLQAQVETLIAQRLEGLRSKRVEHAAAVVIDNATGHVLALAGSRDYFASDGGQINGAWVPHSPGSALKPFTYALAFERGATPATIVADLPLEFQTGTGLYRPENYDHKLYGPMTCRHALGNSLNISAVRVLRSLGGAPPLLDNLHSLGLTTLTESADHYGLGLTIGNAPVRLLELANAYAALARLGLYQPWTLRADEPSPPGVRLIDERCAWWIADILSDNQARVLTFGLRSPLHLPFRVAAKTGTSTSYRDNWALGYTPEFTVGVWAGNFEGKPMENISGVTGAGPIFRDIFLYLQQHHALTWFNEPEGLVRSRIDPRTGKRLTAQSPAVRLSREEAFFGNAQPQAATVNDYDNTGRALLPHEYAKWIGSRDNWLGDLVTIRPTAVAPLRITHPVNGLTIRLDPDLPGTQRLLLQAGPGEVVWSSDTLKVEQQGTQWFADLVPGHHVITAQSGGETQRVTVVVVR